MSNSVEIDYLNLREKYKKLENEYRILDNMLILLYSLNDKDGILKVRGLDSEDMDCFLKVAKERFESILDMYKIHSSYDLCNIKNVNNLAEVLIYIINCRSKQSLMDVILNPDLFK